MYRTITGYLRAYPGSFRALILAIVVALTSFACVSNQPNQNAPVSNPPANSQTTANTNANTAPAETEAAVSNVPITLPVVDALLSDENFLGEVKKSVQPTDEELDKLRTAARDAVLKLNEQGFDDDSRSTKTSLREADKQVKQILGNDKGDKFLTLARKYWSGGDTTALVKPNEIPKDTRIVVNSPAYRLDIFQDGQLVKSYKVGIGYPEFPLPTGLRTAKTIIFNPPWTPPDEPWVKGDFAPGKKVEAGSKKNPLGFIKIPIGLPSLIHGGKDPSRLGNFASHGCVGLTNALVQDFTAELAKISGTQITLADIKGYEKTRSETKEVNLSQQIPVELRYETIVVEDGKVHIYRDVYEHGTNTEENLNRVLEAYGVSMANLSPEEQSSLREALEKMAVDAQGKPVEEDDKKVDKKKPQSDRVTRNVKGQKEIVVDVAALKGKGYPAPVNMNK